MSGNSGKETAAKIAPPGGQAYFELDYVPNAVNIQNQDPKLNGSFVVAWLYPDMTAPVQVQQTVASEGGATLMPPAPDDSGVPVAAFVLFNTGQASLSCKPH